ncbi:MAG: cytochrome c family protein [Acetobacteraceae bacterium]|jgi:cytochrome c|nr:cytochrome c family protein [Acetobacteraceae bacterium]
MRRHAVLLAVTFSLAASQSLHAEGDAAAGQRVFNQCRACHVIENNGKNGIGPNLHGVVGRRAASIEGFRYSANMKELGEAGHTWSEEQLRAYLANPKAVVPRGIMSFPGLRNPQQVEDVIAYLKSQAG